MSIRRLLLLLTVISGFVASARGQDEPFQMALTGDSIITRKLSIHKEPEFLKMIDLIRNADAAFTNIEMLFHDYEGYPMTESGGTYMRADPELAKELAWAGFDLGSLANNHAGDYGVIGMRLTMEAVRRAGLVAAGTGNSLPEAREAKFLETSRARVALISVASTFTDHSRAGKSRGGIPARPGLNPLRFNSTTLLSSRGMELLRGLRQEMTGQQPTGDTDRLRLFGRSFEVSDHPGTRTVPNQEDLTEIAAVVNNASRLSDYTMVTIHAHEGGEDRFVPAQFLVTFAHAMIEAGADLFVGHGPHVLRGIEIYQGKPIFYSLGDFIFENETLLRLPEENYERYGLDETAGVADFNDRRYENDTRGFPATPEIWESVVAIPSWKDGELRSIELHPISLGYGKKRSQRGRPQLADPKLSRKIIQDLQRLSEPFGTVIEYRDGIGRVRLPSVVSEND